MRFTFAKSCGGAGRGVGCKRSFSCRHSVNDLRILCILAHGSHSLDWKETIVETNPTTEVLTASWHRAWPGIGAVGDGELVRLDLLARYSEPQRKYHGLQHLRECIQAFVVVGELPPHGHDVEIALWFHDAVYDPLKHDNEQRSADLAVSALQHAGVTQNVTDRVHRLILGTRHEASPIDLDEQILVDVDLSILGSTVERFAEYEQQVRQEYAFVPEAVFWRKRRQILQGFVDRKRIYHSEHFFASREQAARANLQSAIHASSKVKVVTAEQAQAEGFVLAGVVTGTDDDILHKPFDLDSVLLVRSPNAKDPCLTDFATYVMPQALGAPMWNGIGRALSNLSTNQRK